MIKRKVDNKLRGAFGETTYTETGATIRINRKRHKNRRALKMIPRADRPLINMIVHEELHANHPKMHERTVRKLARKRVAGLSRKRKNKLYSMYA